MIISNYLSCFYSKLVFTPIDVVSSCSHCILTATVQTPLRMEVLERPVKEEVYNLSTKKKEHAPD